MVTVIADAFQPPSKEQLAVWAGGPFGLLLFLFVASRIAGSVATFFDKNR